MIWLLIIAFIIAALVIHYWYIILPGVLCAALANWAYDSWGESPAERADRLHHERARQQIAYIEMTATRAMREAAAISGAVTEVRRHD